MPTQDYAETEAEGVPMIRVTNMMPDGTIDMTDTKYIPFDTPRLDIKRVKENDILMVQCGSTTGKVALVPKELENYTFGSFSFVIRGKSKLVTQEYLFAILLSPFIQEQIKQTRNVVTVRPNTSKPSIENLLIPLLPLEEQSEIGQKLLEAYEEKRKREEEIRTILASVDDFVLGELGIGIERVTKPSSETYVIWSDAINNRLDPMYFHPARLRAIEAIRMSGQQIASLAEVAEFRRELVGEIPESVPYVGLENIVSNSGEYVETGEKESISSAFVFQKGDVLFPKLRPYLNKVFYADYEGVCSTEFHVLRAQKCQPFYLFAFLSRSVVVEQTSRLMTGNTLPRLQTEDVENLLVPLPSEEKQAKIKDGVRASYSRMRTLRSQAAAILEDAQKQVEQMIVE